MNTDTNTHTTPPGYWFGVIEHELRHRMRHELSGFDLRRGSWRVLNTIADGATSVDDIAATLPPGRGGRGRGGFARGQYGFRGGERGGSGRGRFGHPRFPTDEERAAFWEQRQQRFAELRERHGFGPGERHGFGPGERRGFGPGEHHRPEGFAHADAACYGHRHHHDDEHTRDAHIQHDHHGHEHPHDAGRRPSRASRVEATIADFVERGWVTLSGDRNEVVELTDAGRAAHESARERIQGLRTSMTSGISEADYATTIATLEAMARNLGWHEKSAPEGAPAAAAAAPAPAPAPAPADDTSAPDGSSPSQEK